MNRVPTYEELVTTQAVLAWVSQHLAHPEGFGPPSRQSEAIGEIQAWLNMLQFARTAPESPDEPHPLDTDDIPY